MTDVTKEEVTREVTEVAREFLQANPDSDEFIKRGVRAGASAMTLEGRIFDEIKQPAVAVAMVDWLMKQDVINTRMIAEGYLKQEEVG